MVKAIAHADEIDAVFAGIDQSHLPGCAVGIAIGGEPVYRKGFGLASIEMPVVLAPSTRLRVGSVTKQFTCLAYLLLCEDGRAAVDDPVGKFLPELHPVCRNVTMRQLMGHTSGIRDVYSIFDRFNDAYDRDGGAAQSVSSSDLLALYHDIDDRDAMPDTRWIYNNGGYLLVGAAIERISGQPLEELMQRRIFEPLAMHETLLLRSDSSLLPNRACQHVVNPQGGYERMSWGLDNYAGGGALVSTVDDLLRWMAHMDAPKVGTAGSWAEMRRSGRLANGAATAYGFGLQVKRWRGLESLSHTGNALGGNAHLMKIPAAALDIVVVSNRQDVWSPALTEKVLATCFEERSVKETPAHVPFATGTYLSATSGRVIQLFAGEFRLFGVSALQMVSIDGLDLPFEADERGVLRFAELSDETGQSIALSGDRERPRRIHFDDFGTPDELERIEPPGAIEALEIEGRYHSAAIHVEATVRREGGDIRLKTRGQFGSVDYRLESLGEGVWRARGPSASRVGFIGGLVSFDASLKEFAFSSYQMRSIRFRRCEC